METITVRGEPIEVERCERCRMLMSPELVESHTERHARQDAAAGDLLDTSEWKRRHPKLAARTRRKGRRANGYAKRSKQMSMSGVEKNDSIPKLSGGARI